MRTGRDFVFLAALPLAIWGGYGRDAQHTAVSGTRTQPLNQVHWSAPVDLVPQANSSNGDLYIHYGSPASDSQ